GPKVSGRSKARFEKEVGIANTTEDDLLELLSRLGFDRVMTVSKSRKRFHLDGIEIDLDVVEGLGVFCEMEIVSDDIRTAEERILDMMRRMGWSRFERRSYLEMLLSKQF
ncbi:MAG: class IV adenylate cyclase, partial [Thermoplasmatota archaeon]